MRLQQQFGVPLIRGPCPHGRTRAYRPTSLESNTLQHMEKFATAKVAKVDAEGGGREMQRGSILRLFLSILNETEP